MAIIRKGPNGDVSGRIGDKIYRVRNKKNIVCKKPASQKISQSPDSVKNRSRFANTIHFAKLIKSIPELYSCWKSAKIPGRNGIQRIIKHNSKKFSITGITSQNIISPPGLTTYGNSIIMNNSNIIIQSKLNEEISDRSFKLVALLSLYSETGNEFLLLQTDNVSFQNGSALKEIISLTPYEVIKINLCKKALHLSAFISSSPKLLWSSTIPFEFVTKS